LNGNGAEIMATQRKTFPRLFLARSEPFRLVSDRVFLRPPERGDYEDWASLRARSRNFLTPWEPSWPPDALSRTSFRARIARYAEDWRIDQGYMTAALPLVLDFAFERLRLHRVEAACLPTNIPSRALLLHTGFQQEGYARNYLLIDGKWQDHLLFAVLREDWRG
jgi:ribosomal-protein-alanine N-acetyltransferase